MFCRQREEVGFRNFGETPPQEADEIEEKSTVYAPCRMFRCRAKQAGS